LLQFRALELAARDPAESGFFGLCSSNPSVYDMRVLSAIRRQSYPLESAHHYYHPDEKRHSRFTLDTHSHANCRARLMFKHSAHFLCAFSELFLKSANQFVILTFRVCEIVVGQLSVLLFELTLDFIPGTFELEFVHINYSTVPGLSVLSFRHSSQRLT
jgi:hypothetical protein